MLREIEYRFFATCAKGVEEVLAGELNALDMKSVTTDTAGVYFSGSLTDCYRANVYLRTANRVLLELKRFEVKAADDLYNGVKGIPWGEHFRYNQTFAVFANVRGSKPIKHSGFAALKAKDAIADYFRVSYGRRPSVDTSDPDVRIFIRIENEDCVVNIDTSGEGLHKRGYRKENTKAPMRETLAAAILLLAGYDGTCDFVDFMCGSGTIAIEAALIAHDIAPGLMRKSFGFQRLHTFKQREWMKVLKEASNRKKRYVANDIYASDISKKAVEIAKGNARKADMRKFMEISVADFKDTRKKRDTGIIVTNPPYGERLNAGEEDKLKALYKSLGDTMKKSYAGYDAYVFTGKPELIKSIGLKAAGKTILYNGPIECRLVKYELY